MDRKMITDAEVKKICKGARYEDGDGVIFCDELVGKNPPNYRPPFRTCSPGGICIANKFDKKSSYIILPPDIEKMYDCHDRPDVNKFYEDE